MLSVLHRAQRIGFLGPGPVEAHLVHAAGFAQVVGTTPQGLALDLGSGAGVPGLALALRWPASQWVLLDSQSRRTGYLTQAVEDLALGDRVRVVNARAEEFAAGGQRQAYALVVARSFGSPGVVAECAAPFLTPGGRLVVSEPPDSSGDRWDHRGLALLGMAPGPVSRASGASFQEIIQDQPCPGCFPRRSGVAARRPLF